jgi:hypothetical protein
MYHLLVLGCEQERLLTQGTSMLLIAFFADTPFGSVHH